MTRSQVWRTPQGGWDVALPAQTRLRLARVDERWDNTHAMTVRGYRFTLRLMVLDGPSRGASIDVQIEGNVIDALDDQFAGVTLPPWLAVATSAKPAEATGSKAPSGVYRTHHPDPGRLASGRKGSMRES